MLQMLRKRAIEARTLGIEHRHGPFVDRLIGRLSFPLTGAQLRAIGESGGMVGLNFANGFLRADGKWESENGLDTMLRHLDRMMRLAGEDHVGLGSDFDGARIPSQIGDAAGLPRPAPGAPRRAPGRRP